MKTKLIQKIKEELKKYCWAENGCTGDSSDKKLIGFIEKAISQSKEELMEEIKKKYPCRFCGNSGRVWSSIGNFVPCNTENDCILEDLNKR